MVLEVVNNDWMKKNIIVDEDYCFDLFKYIFQDGNDLYIDGRMYLKNEVFWWTENELKKHSWWFARDIMSSEVRKKNISSQEQSLLHTKLTQKIQKYIIDYREWKLDISPKTQEELKNTIIQFRKKL